MGWICFRFVFCPVICPCILPCNFHIYIVIKSLFLSTQKFSCPPVKMSTDQQFESSAFPICSVGNFLFTFQVLDGTKIHIRIYINKPEPPLNNNAINIMRKIIGSILKYSPNPPQTPAIVR